MVAMLRDVPPRTIPDQPDGPYWQRDYVSFRTLDLVANNVLSKCMRKKGDGAQFGWARPGMS